MKKSIYPDRDYSFGRTMVTLRARIGLTQNKLGDLLSVSRRAVSDWEAGITYPSLEHLQAFIALAIQHHAFPLQCEVEEIRAFWQSAHQKVLLDEDWLVGLLPCLASPPEDAFIPFTSLPFHSTAVPLVDWDDALDVPTFYGREQEMKLLTDWVITERCRVVSVLGLGGIGKSALAITLMHHIAEHFEMVIWRSLQDQRTWEELLDDCLRVLAPQSLSGAPATIERHQDILMEQLRTARVLLVLDHLEAVLDEGDAAGRMRPGFEGFGRFLRLSAETVHQSCVLLTSREKPAILAPMEGSHAPVRVLRLAQLDEDGCERLLAEKGVKGSLENRARLIEIYTGNPLALKIVAQTILDLFEGEIAPFLEQGEVIFGGVRELLDEQFARLSSLEQCVLLWFAILREPSTLDELLDVLVTPVPRVRLLEALEALYRHSLVEHGQKQGSFALQSVVMEYLTAWLVTKVSTEIQAGKPDRLIAHGIALATTREYIQLIQERLIVAPILTYLRSVASPQTSLEERLLELLGELSSWPVDQQGYAPGNLVTLLGMHWGHLH